MDTSKLLKGAIAGGVAYFLLGYLVYGVLLAGTMEAYSNPAAARPMEEFVWWAMIVGNLFYGCLLSYVILKAGVSGFSGGMSTGAVVALLAGMSVDLMIYATSTMMNSPMGIVVDVIAGTVMGAVVGGIVAWAQGMGGSKAA